MRQQAVSASLVPLVPRHRLHSEMASFRQQALLEARREAELGDPTALCLDEDTTVVVERFYLVEPMPGSTR
jgi:hypothetical protein